jgi:hypothetical protein
MLHYETIDPSTLELLTELLQIPEFSGLRLARGTSLALQIGHRKSIDLDLFGKLDADDFAVSSRLSRLGESILLKQTQNIHIYLVNGIKVDLVNYPYPWIEEVNDLGQLRLAGKKDIAAMKLAAITGRGTRKDFIDLYFLLQEFDLKTMIYFYSEKFHDGSPFLVLKSLSYFEDAEFDQDPYMIREVEWRLIKETISFSVMEYLKNL